MCNGGGGIAGVRKTADPAGTIFVRNPDIAQNLNMQVAKRECGNRQFFVRSDPDGIISFGCQEEAFVPGQNVLPQMGHGHFPAVEMSHKETFKPASKGDWKKYASYLK